MILLFLIIIFIISLAWAFLSAKREFLEPAQIAKTKKELSRHKVLFRK